MSNLTVKNKYPYTFEVRNVFIKISENTELTSLIKNNSFFHLETLNYNASANFKIKGIEKSEYINNLTSKTYSKQQLKEICPNELLYIFN
tara:strand:- start:771 stop:1040 length:270 start_codon:yes stop_codon:yes gene_type:complete